MAINLHQDFCSCDNKMGTCWTDVGWKVENMMTKLARQKEVLEECRKAFNIAFNTVECDSIDEHGRELPWYFAAKQAIKSIQALSVAVEDQEP